MADDVGSAAAVLRSQGSHVLQLVPMADRAAPGIGRVLAALNWSSGPTTRDILDFTTQLAVMIRAGISLRQALDGIGEQVTNVKFKRMIQAIKSDVESGKQFSEAIAKFPELAPGKLPQHQLKGLQNVMKVFLLWCGGWCGNECSGRAKGRAGLC